MNKKTKNKKKNEGYLPVRLAQNERVLWRGRPIPGLMPREAIFLRVVGAILLASAGLWWWLDLSDDVMLVIAIGLVYVIIPSVVIWSDSLRRKNRVYTLTNQRILIGSGMNSWRFTALDLDQVPQIKLYMERDGSGSIQFEQQTRYGIAPVGEFEYIDNVRAVYNQIFDAQQLE